MHRRTLLGLLASLIVGCAPGQPAVAPPPAVTPSPAAVADPVPLLDAHQHLRSPAAAALGSDPPRPTVKLPEDLEAFLQARIRAAMDKAALADLYVEDAWLLQSFGPAWIRTRASIAEWWVGSTDEPYALDPVGYGVDGSSAYIASYLRDAKTQRRDAHVLHALTRGAGGRWRIATETLTMGGPRTVAPVTVDDLIRHLDAAGIRTALVLSIAYQFGSAREEASDEYPEVRAENDWTADQVARHPDRLRAFCSFNPRKSYALKELDRCAASGRFRGIKLHVGNSRVDLADPRDVASLRRVFQAANERRLPIVVHLAPWGTSYGRREAETFLREVLPAAPDIPVQIAHLGSPGHLDPASDAALAVLAEAVAAGDPRAKNLWFDLTTVAPPDLSPEDAKRLAARIRQIGVARVVYGSDMADKDHLAPREAWATFRKLVPLTDAEVRTIATNVPPYAR